MTLFGLSIEQTDVISCCKLKQVYRNFLHVKTTFLSCFSKTVQTTSDQISLGVRGRGVGKTKLAPSWDGIIFLGQNMDILVTGFWKQGHTTKYFYSS